MIAALKRLFGRKPNHERFPNVWRNGMRFQKGDFVKMQDGRWIELQPTMIGMTIARASAESGRVRRNGKIITVV